METECQRDKFWCFTTHGELPNWILVTLHSPSRCAHIDGSVVWFVKEIRWGHCVTDVEPSYNFENESCHIIGMLLLSTKLGDRERKLNLCSRHVHRYSNKMKYPPWKAFISLSWMLFVLRHMLLFGPYKGNGTKLIFQSEYQHATGDWCKNVGVSKYQRGSG